MYIAGYEINEPSKTRYNDYIALVHRDGVICVWATGRGDTPIEAVAAAAFNVGSKKNNTRHSF